MDSSTGDDGGFKNVVLDIKGDKVYSKMKWEAGVHRVQRVPATESQGRVHTSTATVAVMPECDEVDVQIKKDDIEMSTMRSGGAGGQVSLFIIYCMVVRKALPWTSTHFSVYSSSLFLPSTYNNCLSCRCIPWKLHATICFFFFSTIHNHYTISHL